MNASMQTADRNTHVKIVTTALVLSVLIAWIAIILGTPARPF